MGGMNTDPVVDAGGGRTAGIPCIPGILGGITALRMGGGGPEGMLCMASGWDDGRTFEFRGGGGMPTVSGLGARPPSSDIS